jgi:cytochrome c-type biogenesis protein CcmH
MQAGDLATARDRLQMLLALNPPENLRAILERQIQDLDEQLGRAGEGESTARPAATGRSVRVSVSIAPELKAQLPQAAPLFILARDPAGGPPLAVQRHSASSAPLTIELTERDAMTPSRTIAGVDRVQIIARISQSGAPQAQSGDFYGQIDHTFSADGGDAVNIVIDKVVP